MLRMALRNFLRRKTRTILTTLGIVIGTMCIVVMFSLGIGISAILEESFKYMGDMTTIQVYPRWDEKGQPSAMDDDLVAQIERIKNVRIVSPELSINGPIVSGKYKMYANITGMRIEAMEAWGFNKIRRGEMLSYETEGYPVVFGFGRQYEFYNPSKNNWWMDQYWFDPSQPEEDWPEPNVNLLEDKVEFSFDWMFGEKLMPDENGLMPKKPISYKLNVTGILEPDLNYGEQNYTIYMRLEDAIKLRREYEKQQGQSSSGSSFDRPDGMPGKGSSGGRDSTISYDNIRVKVTDAEATTDVISAIRDLGVEAYGSNIEYIQEMRRQIDMVSTMFGIMGVVTLLVSALGIANTMMTSIYERTHEIGVMKVLGCKLADLGKLFLAEAGMIGLAGGIVGCGIAFAFSGGLNYLVKNSDGGIPIIGMIVWGTAADSEISVVPLWLVAISLAIAAGIGLVAGFFPARRAMKLSALDAIRNE